VIEQPIRFVILSRQMDVIVPGPDLEGGAACSLYSLPIRWMMPRSTADVEEVLTRFVSTSVPHTIAIKIVLRMRRHATQMCYNTHHTFKRGVLVDMDQVWDPLPDHVQFLRALSEGSGISFRKIHALDACLHAKRAYGITRHPDKPMDVICYVFASDKAATRETCIWLNLTLRTGQLGIDAIKPTIDSWTCYRCGNKSTDKKKKFQKCSQCRWARYCSEECRQLDWQEAHKKECAAPISQPPLKQEEAEKKREPDLD
jgi:hypothetical protein